MSSSTSESTKPIEFVAAIHPASEAYFQSLAPSANNIRTVRDNIHVSCTQCYRGDDEGGVQVAPVRQGSTISYFVDCQELKFLIQCKSVWYCSKECQKNWPKHKHHCNEVDGSGILKLVKTLQANPVLDMVLQECFILDFDLLRRPRLDKPFMARVDIALEPANITDFGAIFFGQSPVGETVQGMVQVSGFTPGTPAMMRDLAPRRKEMWREARAQADTDGFRRDSIRLVEITNSGTDNSLTFPIHIRASTLKMVEQGKVLGFPSTSAITGETTILPFCVEKCMEFMNTHIRADKKNQLLLRTEMRPSDIQVICDAATNSSNLPANILMEKMAREQIYKPFLASRASKSLGTQSDQ